MPLDCPRCEAEGFGYTDGPLKVIEEHIEGYLPISTTLACKKCSFKWIQFYEEREWIPLEEFNDLKAAYVSFRNPNKPYKELHRDHMP